MNNDLKSIIPSAKMRAQVAVLKDIVRDGYGGHTIENVITQLEQRVKEIEINKRGNSF